MITAASSMQKRNGAYISVGTYFGVSSDTKPNDVANGSLLIEMDTGKKYLFSAGDNNWYEIGASDSDDDDQEET